MRFLELDETTQRANVLGIDPQTNPDYTFWIPQTSTNLSNYIRLLYVSEANMRLSLSIESPLCLWTPPTNPETLNIDPDLSIQRLSGTSNSIVLSGGTYVEDCGWIYPIYILARNIEVPGQYICTLSIGTERINIGIIVEAENEFLSSMMTNKGFEPSPLITKALYGGDLYGSNPDWTLLNNGFRELALEYMSTLGSKGSLRSLKNSLAWFGYGPLVELKETWRSNKTGKLIERPLSQTLDDDYKNLSKQATKTAIICLSLDTSKITDLNQNPLSLSGAELRLKMYLLGQFFARYFMPVHLSLYSSHLSTPVSTNIRLSSGIISSTGIPKTIPSIPFDSECSDSELIEGGISGSTQVIRIPLSQHPHALSNTGSEYFKDLSIRNTSGNLPALNSIGYYSGLGAQTTISMWFWADHERKVQAQLVSGTLRYTSPSGSVQTSSASNINSSSLSLDFVFRVPGTHRLDFSFIGGNGKGQNTNTYKKTIKVIVENNLVPEIEYKKIIVKADSYKSSIGSKNEVSIDSDGWYNYIWTRSTSLGLLNTYINTNASPGSNTWSRGRLVQRKKNLAASDMAYVNGPAWGNSSHRLTCECPGGQAFLCDCRDMVMTYFDGLKTGLNYTVEMTVKSDDQSISTRGFNYGFWIDTFNLQNGKYSYTDNTHNIINLGNNRTISKWSTVSGLTRNNLSQRAVKDLGGGWYRLRYTLVATDYMSRLGVYVCNAAKDFSSASRTDGSWWVGDVVVYEGTTPLTTSIGDNSSFIPQFHQLADLTEEDRKYGLAPGDTIIAIPVLSTSNDERVQMNTVASGVWAVTQCSDNSDISQYFGTDQSELLLSQSRSLSLSGRYRLDYKYVLGTEAGTIESITPFSF